MKYILILILLVSSICPQAQVPYNYTSSGSNNFSSGTTSFDYTSIDVGNSSFNISSSAQVTLRGANYVHATQGFVVSGLSSGGSARLTTDPNGLGVASFHANGFSGIPKYSRFEVGLDLPDNVQDQINSFLSGSTGLNPYDPDQVTVFCGYNCVGAGVATFYRNGFYYHDFTTQNNAWTEQATDYTFRVRFAPPLPGTYNGTAYVLVNGSVVATQVFNFTVANNGNPGFLSTVNSNLRKLQFDNGDIFFGVGQNTAIDAPVPSPTAYDCIQTYPSCVTPTEYSAFRNRITDLANHKGNFIRIRLDPEYGFPVEWEDKHMFNSETRPLKSLVNCLNNYDHNQSAMWELDKVVKLCEDNDIYYVLTTLEDQDWNSGNPYGISNPWARNPYSALLGNNSTGIGNFFTNTQAKTYFKKMLYYLAARWGYSTSTGIWEMVNETDNIDGNAPNSGGNPYNNNPTYRSNVDQWICDMTSYLGTFYPWHPATTGYGSDAAGVPNCLNVWSSNSYNYNVSGGSFQEGNLNDRAIHTAGYFNNFRPFFYGEVGSGNDLIDNNSDKEFHNAVWATTMMGGISNGLYWNDIFQKYGVNHRANFDALRTFVQRVDWTQNYEPFKLMTSSSSFCPDDGKRIETFWQRNGAKNVIIGWTLNRSSVWLNDGPAFANAGDFSTSITSSGFSGTPNSPLHNFSNTCDPNIEIDNLFANTKYHVSVFDTYDPTNQQVSSFNQISSVGGKIKFQRDMPFNYASPFAPDYAFIITINSSRPAAPGQNDADTLMFNTGDTLCINGVRDIGNSNFNFSWYVNQKQRGSDSLFCLEGAPADSAITVQLVAEHTVTKDKYYKDYLFTNNKKANITSNLAQVFPNPANDKVTVVFTHGKPDNFTVTITDGLGQILMRTVNQDKISVNTLPNGFYLLNVSSGKEETTIKLLVEH